MITYRPVSSLTSKLKPNGAFPSTPPFSKTFASFEGEERVNWRPAESEEEEMLNFKHRTIESSVSIITFAYLFAYMPGSSLLVFAPY